MTDAGPLIALIDAGEPAHEACRKVMQQQPDQLATTWAPFTEAMYLLGDAGGWPAQRALWQMVERGLLRMIDLSSRNIEQARSLMEKYRDIPMDLADATLVATAYENSWNRIFTLDADFMVYRLRGGRSFTLLPSQASLSGQKRP